MKKKIARWYDLGLWNAGMVAAAVEKELLSGEDYREITGADYAEKE